jgi:hypothetical protein
MHFLLSENIEYRVIIIPPAELTRPELLNGIKKLIFLSQNGPQEGASQFNRLLKIKPDKSMRDRS